MKVCAADAAKIDETCKEAVVDGLINNLSARVSGAGDFHRTIYKARPSGLLVSGFLVPLPEEDRDTDEEASPLQINAHGLDFHIDRTSATKAVSVRLKAVVYVRIFPTALDLGPNGRLTPTFSLRPEVARELGTRSRAALDALRKELNVARYREHTHPDWARRENELRSKIHADLGVTYDVPKYEDASEETDAAAIPEPDASDDGDSAAVIAGSSVSDENDAAYKDMDPPQKWLRLDLDLPAFNFTIDNAAADAERGSRELNEAIARRLNVWFESTDPEFGGARWGYRRGAKILPSDVRNWDKYLANARANDLRPVYPMFDVRWALSATADPLHDDRLLVHVAVENWTPEPTGIRDKEIERAIFQVSVTVELEQGSLKPLL